jgi:hypothetical protein
MEASEFDGEVSRKEMMALVEFAETSVALKKEPNSVEATRRGRKRMRRRTGLAKNVETHGWGRVIFLVEREEVKGE